MLPGASDHAHWAVSSSREVSSTWDQAAIVLPKAWLWSQPSQRAWAGFNVDGVWEPGSCGKVGMSESELSDGCQMPTSFGAGEARECHTR